MCVRLPAEELKIGHYLGSFAFLGAFAKCRQAITSVVVSTVYPSVYPHGETRLPRDGFILNLIFEYFSKFCLENSSLIKI